MDLKSMRDLGTCEYEVDSSTHFLVRISSIFSHATLSFFLVFFATATSAVEYELHCQADKAVTKLGEEIPLVADLWIKLDGDEIINGEELCHREGGLTSKVTERSIRLECQGQNVIYSIEIAKSNNTFEFVSASTDNPDQYLTYVGKCTYHVPGASDEM